MRRVLSVFWHGVRPESTPPGHDSTDPSAAQFEAHIEFLTARFTPISISDYLSLADGRPLSKSFAKPPVLLGFDDGFRSVITTALPILARLNAPAIFFVVGEVIRTPAFVPWFVEMKHIVRRARTKRVTYREVSLDLGRAEDRRRARHLVASAFRTTTSETERQSLMEDLADCLGVPRPVQQDLDEDLRFVTEGDLAGLDTSSRLAVGSHAMTHRYLSQLSYDDQAHELQMSDSLLRERVPSYYPVIAYPAGSFNNATIALAEKTYRAGFGVFLGASHRYRYAYPRVGLAGGPVSEVARAVSPLRLNCFLPIKRWLYASGIREREV